MAVQEKLKHEIAEAVKRAHNVSLPLEDIILDPTKKEFSGDYTFVVFPLVKQLSKNPADIAQTIGEDMVNHSDWVNGFNVIKGFLNLELSASFWNDAMDAYFQDDGINQSGKGKKMLVEFASPNTNKPLHLGHVRNILLGWSVSQIASSLGYTVGKTQIINDRGIAICKSMLAWLKTGKGSTPETTGKKGDHFVGQFYVEFENMFQKEYTEWQQTPNAKSVFENRKEKDLDQAGFFKKFKNEYFNQFSPIGQEAKEMLLKWEQGDSETFALWKRMNDWVYAGFDKTYNTMGVEFDHLYYESQTYLLGKESIQKGLEQNVFYKKEDGSVWVDLEPEGMDQKIVLRSDGTSVYMTQDIGTAQQRYKDHKMNEMIYVVADEQDYHFNALFAILSKLGEPYSKHLKHLSYGMVDLPTGKMKSREGTVVDADDLMDEVIAEARNSAQERGGLEGLTEEHKEDIYRKIGLAALKFFIIKVNAKKRMTFDPKESVDMQGTTGPYIQNAFVRIQSILRNAKLDMNVPSDYAHYEGEMNDVEKELIMHLIGFGELVQEAMNKLDPSVIANYSYALAKSYHRFYHECRILNLDDQALKSFRLSLSMAVAATMQRSMSLLGIEMPDYM